MDVLISSDFKEFKIQLRELTRQLFNRILISKKLPYPPKNLNTSNADIILQDTNLLIVSDETVRNIWKIIRVGYST